MNTWSCFLENDKYKLGKSNNDIRYKSRKWNAELDADVKFVKLDKIDNCLSYAEKSENNNVKNINGNKKHENTSHFAIKNASTFHCSH